MKDGVAELIVKQNWPLMKVTSGAYTEEIETTTLANVRKNIEPYGVEIMRFGDFSVTMDPNTTKSGSTSSSIAWRTSRAWARRRAGWPPISSSRKPR